MSQPNEQKNQMNRVYEEYVKQISTQSALLAGFSFAGFTAISYDATTPLYLAMAFGICTSVSIGFELLAMLTSGTLSILAKAISIRNRFSGEIRVAWFTYWGGLFFFLVALILLSWIKIQPAAMFVTGIAILVGIAMLVIIFRFIKEVGLGNQSQMSSQ
jgi:hypothetical protein